MNFNGDRYLINSCTPDCPTRTPGCHDHCKRYKEKRAEYEKRKAIAEGDPALRGYISMRAAEKRSHRAKVRKQFAGHSWGGGRRP